MDFSSTQALGFVDSRLVAAAVLQHAGGATHAGASAAGATPSIETMLRLRSFCVLGSLGSAVLGTSGCFGLVEYGAPAGEVTATDDGLVAAMTGGTAAGSGGLGSGGLGSGGLGSGGPGSGGLGSGGLGSGGLGSGGASDPTVLPQEPEPCAVDCCPAELVQWTGTSASGPLDADAVRPYLSGDGAWLVFGSRAVNLPGSDARGFEEVYLSSLARGTLYPVTAVDGRRPTGDTEANALSANGRFVLLTSSSEHLSLFDHNGASDVYLYDRASAEVSLVSRGLTGEAANGRSLGRDLSPDGRYVVYSSVASDLTPGDDNQGWDVFVWDRQTGLTERVSMGPGDQQKNPVSGNHAHISADGRFVSFHSQSDLLTSMPNGGSFDVFLFDRQSGTTLQLSRSMGGGAADGNTFVLGMSDDGRFLASYGSATNLVEGDTNGRSDVFLFDLTRALPRRVNVGPAGEQADSGTTSVSLSPDGQRLGFSSASAKLGGGDGVVVQSYSYAVTSGELTRVSQSRSAEAGNGDSSPAEFSSSGRCFVFSSQASNLTGASVDDGVRDLFVGRFVP